MLVAKLVVSLFEVVVSSTVVDKLVVESFAQVTDSVASLVESVVDKLELMLVVVSIVVESLNELVVSVIDSLVVVVSVDSLVDVSLVDTNLARCTKIIKMVKYISQSQFNFPAFLAVIFFLLSISFLFISYCVGTSAVSLHELYLYSCSFHYLICLYFLNGLIFKKFFS